MICNDSWDRREFNQAAKKVQNMIARWTAGWGIWNPESLQAFLAGKKDLLLRLLENPHLLEHETFRDLPWAVFHLQDELAHRGDLT